jgi:hypothetical protein
MTSSSSQKTRIEYGDFQTPPNLANGVCQKLVQLGINPDFVIEPTCGVGAFVEAATKNFPSAKIIGIEVNSTYLIVLQEKLKCQPGNDRVEVKQADFFRFNWDELLRECHGTVLVLGNFPWVTNSQQGVIGGTNLPRKHNFQNHSGWEARTGKSNFDISEWMLIQTAMWLRRRVGYVAMLCKTPAARKFLSYVHANRIGLEHAAIYQIDAKKYFDVAVSACLLVCKFVPEAQNYDYDVFPDLDSTTGQRVGHRDGLMVRDLNAFEDLIYLHGESEFTWRSGVKHDCAEIMELRKMGGGYMNGLGETVDIESTLLFPLLKGSDVANNRVSSTDRYVLITQKTVGESTKTIKTSAPKTWAYLESHAQYLDNRKSKIYLGNPRFSIFGVGSYTFAPWKIAICGLYKSLDFRLIGEISGKPTLFDDTVYFISFDSHEEANRVLSLLTSASAQNFLSALIFWDEKRPIKASILNGLNIRRLATAQQLSLFHD